MHSLEIDTADLKRMVYCHHTSYIHIGPDAPPKYVLVLLLLPRVHPAFDPLLSLPLLLPLPPLLNVVHLAFLFRHEEHFQYARYRHAH
jgi:hypothetical protein